MSRAFSSPQRVCGVLLAIVGLSLAVSGCAPTLKQTSLSTEAVEAEREKQREMAFSMLMQRQDRLLNVSYPLLVAAAELCKGAVRPTYGFRLHDKHVYTATLGREYTAVAARHYGLVDEVAVRYVHPQLPAALAGLQVGDGVLAINDQGLHEEDAVEMAQPEPEYGPIPEGQGLAELAAAYSASAAAQAMEMVHRLDAARGSLKLRVERQGRIREIEIPGVPACKYSVQLINMDVVNAFADGNKVGITTGMVRFATTDEELALVVGHEIAHNAMGHLKKKTGNIILGTIFDVAFAVLLGVDTQGLFGRLGGQAFSQAFEAEADYAGLYIVVRAGHDISGAANFWRRMAIEHPGSIKRNFLSTHPSTAERFLVVENAVKEIDEKRHRGEALLPEGKKVVVASETSEQPVNQGLLPEEEKAVEETTLTATAPQGADTHSAPEPEYGPVPEGQGLGRVATAQSKEQVGVTGVWKGDWSAREVDRAGAVVLELKQHGTKVTGTIGFQYSLGDESSWSSASYTEGQIKNGKMKGQILTFEVPDGPQTMRCRFVVRSSSMRGTLKNISASILGREEVFSGKAILQRE